MSEATEKAAPSLLTARGLITWKASLLGAGLPSLPRAALVTHQGGLFRYLTRNVLSRPTSGLSADVRLAGLRGQRVAVARVAGVGAPGLAVVLEELAVAGVTEVVVCDVAAGLDEGLTSGDIVLAGDAITGDGTSPHYAPGRDIVAGDPTLIGRLTESMAVRRVRATSARVWSTDAPFRETARQLAGARERGATVADMETAALYAVASALNMRAAAVLVVADQLSDRWLPPPGMSVLDSQLRSAAAAALAGLRA